MLRRHSSRLKKRTLSMSRSPNSTHSGTHLWYLENVNLIEFQGVQGPWSLLRLGKGSRATPREWDIKLWISDKAGVREPGVKVRTARVAFCKARGGQHDVSELRSWAVCGRILDKFLSLC